MHDDMEKGEGECPEYGDTETRDRKSRHEPREEPKEESVDDEREESEREDIYRQGEHKENRFQGHGDNTPHNREDECGEETLNMNTRHHIGDDEEHQCGEEPTSEYGHRIQILDIRY